MSVHSKDPAKTTEIIGTSVPRNLMEVLRAAFRKYKYARQLHKSQKAARTAFLPTLRLDDKMLEDIGVTREEAEWAAGLPLQLNAAKAMHAKAAIRRQAEAARPRRGGVKSCVTRSEISARGVIAHHQASTHRQKATPYRLWGRSAKDSAQAV